MNCYQHLSAPISPHAMRTALIHLLTYAQQSIYTVVLVCLWSWCVNFVAEIVRTFGVTLRKLMWVNAKVRWVYLLWLFVFVKLIFFDVVIEIIQFFALESVPCGAHDVFV